MVGPRPTAMQARRGVEARTLFPGVLLMTAMLQSDSEVSADCSEAPIVPRVSIYGRDRPGLHQTRFACGPRSRLALARRRQPTYPARQSDEPR